MQNFDYMTPTRLIFGKESIVKLPEVMRPLGKRVLLTYGGGSIKRLGLYDRVKELMHLRDVGIDDSRLDEMAHHIAVNEGLENAYAPLTEQDIKEILIASL